MSDIHCDPGQVTPPALVPRVQDRSGTTHICKYAVRHLSAAEVREKSEEQPGARQTSQVTPAHQRQPWHLFALL